MGLSLDILFRGLILDTFHHMQMSRGGRQDHYTKGDWTTRQLYMRRETGPQDQDRRETGPQEHYIKEGRLGQTTVTKRETGPLDQDGREMGPHDHYIKVGDWTTGQLH